MGLWDIAQLVIAILLLPVFVWLVYSLIIIFIVLLPFIFIQLIIWAFLKYTRRYKGVIPGEKIMTKIIDLLFTPARWIEKTFMGG